MISKRLYEFKCTACGNIFERMTRDVQNQAEYCPKCGGEAYKKFTAPAIHYRGDGFTGAAKIQRTA